MALIDRFGRHHNYLRLSITDACNFACSYCMPNNKQCELSGDIMSAKEIISLADAFTNFGVDKIRLTGGEPTVRSDFEDILNGLGELNVKLALTTNGYLLDRHFNTLRKNDVSQINISLDTLNKDKFKSITKRNAFDKVYSNLILASKTGFEVKLNAVIMRGVNNNELYEFAKLTQHNPITVRFIEFMPFKDNNWNFGKTFSEDDIIRQLSERYKLTPVDFTSNETANYYRINEGIGKIGIISSISKPFCNNCNRIRVMADGKMKNCLFGNKEFDLIEAHRKGNDLKQAIQQALAQKDLYHGGNSSINQSSPVIGDKRNMHSIGG